MIAGMHAASNETLSRILLRCMSQQIDPRADIQDQPDVLTGTSGPSVSIL
jgi:hypothetical protein